MTDDSARKQRIRDRMRVTGEQYTAAARALEAERRAQEESSRSPSTPLEGGRRLVATAAAGLHDAVDTQFARSGAGIEVENADQIELVEGGIQDAFLEDFACDELAAIDVVDASPSDDGMLELDVVVRGTGGVAWRASARDHEIDGRSEPSEEDDDASDEGFTTWREADVPIELQVRVMGDPASATWRSPEILAATIPIDEVLERIRADEDGRLPRH